MKYDEMEDFYVTIVGHTVAPTGIRILALLGAHSVRCKTSVNHTIPGVGCGISLRKTLANPAAPFQCYITKSSPADEV